MGKPKCKVMPSWNRECDSARSTSLFWHDMWTDCGGVRSGVVYDVMKSTDPNTIIC